MLSIAQAIKAKVENYSRDNIEKARDKCFEAKALVKKSLENNEPEIMFLAVEKYLEAIEHYPKLIEPYLSISFICIKFNKVDEALMLLNKAIELEPFNPKVKEMLEKVRVKRKNKSFNQQKEKYVKKEKASKGKTSQAKSKGLFKRVKELFSFSSIIESKNTLESDEKGVLIDDFASALAHFSKIMNKQDVKMSVNKDTLNQLTNVMSDKNHSYHTGTKIEKTPEFNPKDKIDLNQKIVALEKLKKSMEQDKLIVKVNNQVFNRTFKKL
jgi:tetratricopeptide (TPR) repeat protein